MSTTSFETSESTLKRLGSLEESDEEDEDDGTAKADRPNTPPAGTADWRGSLSQNRLTSLFDGWLRPASPTLPNKLHHNAISLPPGKRKSVSEPKLVDQHTGSDVMSPDSINEIAEDLSLSDFDEMLVCIYWSWRNEVAKHVAGRDGPERRETDSHV